MARGVKAKTAEPVRRARLAAVEFVAEETVEQPGDAAVLTEDNVEVWPGSGRFAQDPADPEPEAPPRLWVTFCRPGGFWDLMERWRMLSQACPTTHYYRLSRFH
jgi:hypothetical protein